MALSSAKSRPRFVSACNNKSISSPNEIHPVRPSLANSRSVLVLLGPIAKQTDQRPKGLARLYRKFACAILTYLHLTLLNLADKEQAGKSHGRHDDRALRL